MTIEELIEQCVEKNYKKGLVFKKALDNGLITDCKDLYKIQEFCNYKFAWVYCKCEELGIEFVPKD